MLGNGVIFPSLSLFKMRRRLDADDMQHEPDSVICSVEYYCSVKATVRPHICPSKGKDNNVSFPGELNNICNIYPKMNKNLIFYSLQTPQGHRQQIVASSQVRILIMLRTPGLKCQAGQWTD